MRSARVIEKKKQKTKYGDLNCVLKRPRTGFICNVRSSTS